MKRTFATIELQDSRKMRVELFPEYAPITCQNFIKLANEGFYEGVIFHRVIPNFMVQGGGLNPQMQGKAGAETIFGEFASNGFSNPIKHTLGTISMARTNVKNSASSQFFICVHDCKFLDGEYAAFGRTVDDESIKVAIDISKVPTHSVGYFENVPVRDIVIKRVYIQEFDEE